MPPLDSRPSPFSPGAAVGIDEAVIRDVVHAFYGRIQKDALLGPIFGQAIEDWDRHLAKMCAFWSSVLLMTGRYAGKPMVAHIRLGGLEAAHFRHWLSLFEATVTERCDEQQAALLIDRARRIAQSLLMGINVHRGEDAGAAARALAEHRPAA